MSALKGNSGPWMEAGREAGLVLSAQHGDRGAYMELVDHYSRPLHRLAHALTRHPDDAIELTHEAFVYGWKNISHLPVGRPFCPWLFRATRNLSIAVRRRRAGHGEAATTGPARQRAFLAALSDLTPDEQLVLALRVGEKLSYQDIGTTCELPTRTVLARVASARERLRTRLTVRAREAA
jgi:RNA polymerase sigma-70 factor (ECF subfamily)